MLIIFDKMVADIPSNNKLNPIVKLNYLSEEER